MRTVSERALSNVGLSLGVVDMMIFFCQLEIEDDRDASMKSCVTLAVTLAQSPNCSDNDKTRFGFGSTSGSRTVRIT